MEKTHWFLSVLQRLGQVAGATIIGGILGYPVLHWYVEKRLYPANVISPAWGYLAIALGLGLALVILSRRDRLQVVMNALARISRRKYVILLLVISFLSHFAVLKLIAGGGQGAPIRYDPAGWEFWGRDKSAMYPPGERFLMQTVHAAFGHSSTTDNLYVAALVTLACWLVYRLGAMAFGETAGRVAGLLLCFLPSWSLYGNLEYDLLLGTLFLLLTYLFFARHPSTHRFWYLLPYGLLLGFACLVKPICLFFPLIHFIVYLGTELPLRQAIYKTAIIALFMFSVIAPWTYRNYKVFEGQFVLISTNFGVVLWTANNAQADGREMMVYPLKDEQGNIIEQDEIAMNERLIREAKAWIRDNPLQFLKLVAWRIAWTWGSDTSFISTNLHATVPAGLAMKAVKGVVQVSYLALVLVWVFGLFAYRREILGSMLGVVLLLPIVYIWGLHLICQAHGQHHLSALPFMIALVSAIVVRRAGHSIKGMQLGTASA